MDWQNLFSRNTVATNLEKLQDIVITLLCISLFCTMLIILGKMFLSLVELSDFSNITSDILLLLILIELSRILIISLKEKRVSIENMIEVTLVASLQEVVGDGVLHIPLNKILGICAFLIVLGGLLYLRALIPVKFDPTEAKEKH